MNPTYLYALQIKNDNDTWEWWTGDHEPPHGHTTTTNPDAALLITDYPYLENQCAELDQGDARIIEFYATLDHINPTIYEK